MSETIAYNYVDKEDKRLSHFVGIGLVLGFLLPHTSTLFMLANPLFCLLYQFYKQNQFVYKYNWIVCVPVLMALLINMPLGVSVKSMMSGIILLLYFLCFPMVKETKVPILYFYVILSVIVLTQLAYVLKISFIIRFLDTYYPISIEDAMYYGWLRNNVTMGNIMHFRLGGLYRNPNQCSRSLTFLMASFLILNKDKRIRELLPFIIICVYGVLLTGSRTGFIIASLIIIVFLFLDNKVSVAWRYGIVLVAIAGFVFLTTVGANSFRGFDVNDTGSSDLKIKTFLYYLSTENSFISLLFGHLDSNRFDSSVEVMRYFDADYGYIVFQYGFLGFASVLVYFFTLFLRTNKTGRIFFILMLWMITSTIVTSYRALFIFMLLLSVVYNNNKRGVSS